MNRDTKIVLAFVGAIPTLILAASTLCSWAIAHGASMQWRTLFRVMCHGRVERSFALFDVAMPICARCTGIYIGLLAGLALFAILPAIREDVMRRISFAAVTPLAIDGLTQLAGFRESTNTLRVITGIVSGLAFGLWILSAVDRRVHRAVTTP